MSEEAERPWWTYSKEEQKKRIEEAVDEFLSRPGELTDRQNYIQSGNFNARSIAWKRGVRVAA